MSNCELKLSDFPFLTGCSHTQFAIPILNYESGDYENYNINFSDLLCLIGQDYYITGGTYSAGFLYFSGNGVNFIVDVHELLDDTNTYTTGSTLSGTTLILSRNDGLNLYTDLSSLIPVYFDTYISAGTYSAGFLYFSGHGINFSVDVTPLIDDTNTFVTGATLSGDSLILTRNDGFDIFVDLSKYNYDDEINFLQVEIDYHTGDTNNPHQTSFYNLTQTAHTHTLSEIIDYIPPFDVYTTGATLSGNTLVLYRNDGGVIYTDLSSLSPTIGDIFVTGGTISGNTLVLSRNDGQDLYVDLSQLHDNDFTGNTSATCINDLYVHNLGGCSPIEVLTDINVRGTLGLNYTTFHYLDRIVTEAELYSAATNPIILITDPGLNKSIYMDRVLITHAFNPPYDYNGLGSYVFYINDNKLDKVSLMMVRIESQSITGTTFYPILSAGNTLRVLTSGDVVLGGVDWNGNPNNPDVGSGDLRIRIWYKIYDYN